MAPLREAGGRVTGLFVLLLQLPVFDYLLLKSKKLTSLWPNTLEILFDHTVQWSFGKNTGEEMNG